MATFSDLVQTWRATTDPAEREAARGRVVGHARRRISEVLAREHRNIDPHEHDDIAQTCVENVWQWLEDGGRPIGAGDGFLRLAARRAAIDWLRARQTRRAEQTSELNEESTPGKARDPEGELLDRELGAVIAAAIEVMPPKQREILKRLHLDEPPTTLESLIEEELRAEWIKAKERPQPQFEAWAPPHRERVRARLYGRRDEARKRLWAAVIAYRRGR